MRTVILFVAAMFSSVSAQAQVSVISDNQEAITLAVTERYVLGDNDTLSSAKAIALEQAKRSASDYAGTYVESKLVVDGNNITKQQVRVLSAGFLEVLETKNSRSVDSNGSVVLDTNATIRLSKQSIKDGLAKLKSDPERKAKIERLEQENARLNAQLYELTNKINIGSRDELIEARNDVLSKLDSNREATKKVFEVGTLFQLASLGAQEGELAKETIQRDLFDYFKHQTKLTLGNPEFRKNTNGTFDVLVPVDWELDKEPLMKALEPLFRLNTSTNHRPWYSVSIYKYENEGNKAKRPFSEDLQEYIREHVIAIEVKAGDKAGYLPIGALGGFFGRENFVMHYKSEPNGNRLINEKYRNPIVIKGVSEKTLKSITAIESRVVVLPATDLAKWKYE